MIHDKSFVIDSNEKSKKKIKNKGNLDQTTSIKIVILFILFPNNITKKLKKKKKI